jgi:tRNA pseudouridine32 synthase/23S rRNA pseudouridine746 synthase
MSNKHFISFKTNIKEIESPKKFTFPFYYEPHILSKIAVTELQEQLEKTNEWQHDFGLHSNNGIGKMFGVLVVKNQQNKLGYLSAFSGKILGKNDLVNFVPPVFDIFSDDFYQKEEQTITEISQEINLQENNAIFLKLNKALNILLAQKEEVLSEEKEKLGLRRKERRTKKKEVKDLRLQEEKNPCKFVSESLHDKFYYRELSIYWKEKVHKIKIKVNKLSQSILDLKNERIQRSENLHQLIFDNYHFLNKNKKVKSLNTIFKEINKKPIAGTGNCVAPKLLQFAFKNGLKPIAMAEFWWGKPLKNKVRKHKNYYPACNGKCKPILNYMLNGLEVDENLILINLAKDKKIEVLFEDEYLVVINKPSELLSVPGKNIIDSVYYRMQQKYPNATGPLIVHRLDMSTSGIMLIAKSKRIHKKLQSQFIKRTIKKQYVAVLNGILKEKLGKINLPLRVNLENTPKQLVCLKHGKKASTNYKVIEIKDNKTKIYFYPITGRTHQLRVHAAHYLGLNTPIVGDDLYGIKSDRLYLHACSLEFMHPVKKKLWL